MRGLCPLSILQAVSAHSVFFILKMYEKAHSFNCMVPVIVLIRDIDILTSFTLAGTIAPVFLHFCQDTQGDTMIMFGPMERVYLFIYSD